MAGDAPTPAEVLLAIPQQPPFRFIDVIHELDDDHIVASYRFRPDEFFYRGHFPGNPITPGVILIETIAQAGVVALGLYLAAKNGLSAKERGLITLFTDAQADFHGVVRPGDEVFVEARKLFFRRAKLRVEASLRLADGTLACSGTFSGMGVPVP